MGIIHGTLSYAICRVDDKSIFCRNPYNVTGLCNRSSCPLANSRYATIREHEGRCYLYIKTAERAHTPKNLWEKIKVSSMLHSQLTRLGRDMLPTKLKYWLTFLHWIPNLTAFNELRESVGTDRYTFAIFPQVFIAQEQTEVDKNYTILNQDEKAHQEGSTTLNAYTQESRTERKEKRKESLSKFCLVLCSCLCLEMRETAREKEHGVPWWSKWRAINLSID
jgi:hypothetical protein